MLYDRSFLNDRKFLYARPFFPQSFTRKEKEKKESHGWKNHTPLELDLISIDSKIGLRSTTFSTTMHRLNKFRFAYR